MQKFDKEKNPSIDTDRTVKQKYPVLFLEMRMSNVPSTGPPLCLLSGDDNFFPSTAAGHGRFPVSQSIAKIESIHRKNTSDWVG